MIGLAFLLSTFVGLGVLLKFGERADRIAVGLVVVYLVAVPLLEPIKIDNWRVGVLIAEACLFVAFWVMAERTSRGWMTAAAGFQLISVLTFLPPQMRSDLMVWTGVAARYGAWGLVTLTFFAGALEVWGQRRYRLEANHG